MRNSAVDMLRGHGMVLIGGEWLYADTLTPTVGNQRPCGHCGKPNTADDHDGCLGEMPGVMNACCGHGTTADAYIQYNDGDRVGGFDAVKRMKLTP